MKTDKPHFAVVVPAAGIGSRMAAKCPKQYLTLAGKTIIEHTLERLISHPQVSKVVVAISPEDERFAALAIANHPALTIVHGGAERADSVLAGLNALESESIDWVLVHDAARPCITHCDIDKLITHCSEKDFGAVLATPVRDTMKRTDAHEVITKTESRTHLWHALTPQMYRINDLKTALCDALKQGAEITDESSAIEWAGLKSGVVIGRDDNLKITRPNDLALASFYLKQQQET